MNTQPPDKLQPPTGLWDALPTIIDRLRNEFLLVSIAYLLIVLAIGFFAPDVVNTLGRGFFYLVVVLAFLAYIIVRVLPTYERLRQQATKPTPETPAPAPSVAGPVAKPGVEPSQESPKESTQEPLSPEAMRDRYLDTLITDCCRARLVGLDPQAADPTRGGLSLERLYVSLDTLTSVEPEPVKEARGSREALEMERARERRPLSALEALARAPDGRIVLLGLPGAGKSTFVRYLALRMAQALRDPVLNLATLLPGWPGRPFLPLIVPLGRLAESLPADAQRGNAGMIERFVCRVLGAGEHLQGYGEVLLAAIRREGGLVLFDGLDEVADLNLRPIVRQAVEDFTDRYGHNGAARFLVTCRTYSYTDSRWQLTGWPTHEIAPLDGERIHQFVDAWHTELSRVDPARSEDYARKCQQMLLALDPSDRRRLAEIAPNPLILTVMSVVHTHKGELPDARALVYEEYVDLLLVRWEMERAVLGQPAQKRSLLDALGVPRITLDNALQELAYRAHEGSRRPDAAGGETQAALATEGLLTDVLQTTFNDLEKVGTFLRYCESANGLVMLQGVAPLPDAPPDAPPHRVYAFPHMTFEEYLAGRYLGRLRNPAAQVREHVDRSDRWREPAMLLGEHLCFRAGDFERVDAILEKLVPDPSPEQPAPEDWRATWLAGDLLMLYRRALQGKPGYDKQVVAQLCALIETGALTARERAAAARTLAVLGDPRPGVDVDPETGRPALQWCLIPSGPFLMGSRREDDPGADDDEMPQHTYDVSHPYWIARYPVTNAQFRAFVEGEAGYRNDEWWTRAGLSWRKGRTGPEMRGGVYDLPNHPAVMLTWYEAVAWCRWLTRRMQEAGSIPDKWKIRLPTEAEWEKAARGGLEIPGASFVTDSLLAEISNLQPLISNPFPARRYPWSNDPDPERANYYDAGIGTTCAAGIFPDGVSPHGCLDLSGNVWEWCATKWVDNYEDYDTKEDNGLEGDARRVVRGGSFANYGHYVRCAYRLRHFPVYPYWYLGFRPVAAPVASEL